MEKGYTLYFKKESCEIKITKIKKNNSWWSNIENNTSDNSIYKWNDCYYLSQNRVALKNCAYALQDQWIKEAQYRLDKILKIKI